jgi:hypothetical protein
MATEAPNNEEALTSSPPEESSLSPTRIDTKKIPEANNERSAVVLALFGPTVGPCVGDFSTTYNRVNGRLYASTKAILFYSNLFGFERRLCLQLSDVEEIESYKSTSIRISMVDCEDHVFKKFPNRDAVLSVLKELVGEYSGGITTVDTFRTLPLSTSGRNSNSDDASDEEAERRPDEPLRPHLGSELTPEPLEPSSWTQKRPRAQSVPLLRRAQSERLLLFKQSNSAPEEKPRPPRRVKSTVSIKHQQFEPHQQSNSDSQTKERSKSLGESRGIPDFDMEKAWNETKQPFTEFALEVSLKRGLLLLSG